MGWAKALECPGKNTDTIIILPESAARPGTANDRGTHPLRDHVQYVYVSYYNQ